MPLFWILQYVFPKNENIVLHNFSTMSKNRKLMYYLRDRQYRFLQSSNIGYYGKKKSGGRQVPIQAQRNTHLLFSWCWVILGSCIALDFFFFLSFILLKIFSLFVFLTLKLLKVRSNYFCLMAFKLVTYCK